MNCKNHFMLGPVMPREKNWIESASIYEVYPLTFRHGDIGKEAIDAHYGNLRGVIEKLDYIQSLHVDAIWLAPIFQSPLRDGFGYNICDYKKIHPLLGTEADFDSLVHNAHVRGIKLILDMVFGHTSNQHPWFVEGSKSRDNPYSDYYVWADHRDGPFGEKLLPNNWLSMDLEIPSAWTWSEERGQYYFHSFNRTMPSLNISNPAVEAELLDVARFWLDRGVDGFRLDAVHHMGHDPNLNDDPIFDFCAGYHGQHHEHTTCRPEAVSFLKKLRDVINAYPERTLPNTSNEPYRPALLGEVMRSQEFLANLVKEDILDLAFNGNLTGTLENYRQIVEEICRTGLASRTAWAMSSHDSTRILDRTMGVAAKPEHAVLYAGMLACLPGGIVIFQGDELGLRHGNLEDVKNGDPLNLIQSFMGESDACRAGMPWIDGANDRLWLKPVESNKALAPEIQGGFSDSPLSQVRELLRLRKDHPALQGDDPPLFPETLDPYVLAVLRRNKEEQENMLCTFNFGSIPKRFQLRKGWDILADVYCRPLGVNFASFIDAPHTDDSVPYTTYCAPAPPNQAVLATRLNRRAQLYASPRYA